MTKKSVSQMTRLENLSELELLEALPEKWVGLVGVVSLTTILDVIDKFGGTTIIFPQKFRKNGSKKLREAIGDEATIELIQCFSDSPVYIPTGYGLINRARHNKIIRLSDEGLPGHEIARRVGVSMRTVCASRRKRRNDIGASSTY